MRKKIIWILALSFLFLLVSSAHAKSGVYLGIQAGYSGQKPSLTGVEFNRNTSFLYGVRAGIKFLMIALEANYFQAAHNMEPKNLLSFAWGECQVDYNFVGLNLKYFFPILMIHPYLTLGYGYYTADIRDIDKDTDKGFNLGLGLELDLGGKFSFLAEGKYHHARLEISDKELKLGDFTVSGGINIYF